jgi:c-di-GMP-binding flagellar brake protein YcgR
MNTRSIPSRLPESPTARGRRHARAIYSVPIMVRMLMPGGVRTTRGVSLDLCEGGLGALLQNKLNVGDVIEIELSLPKRELSAVAIVRHSSAQRCGFEFLGLTSEEREQIADLVAGNTTSYQLGTA